MIKFFNSTKGKIIISLLWGFGLACLFRKVCKGRNCIIYQAPDPNEIKKNTYIHNDKCYKYKTFPTKCGKNVVETKSV
tara:strand:+ start:391 stop:624 length:234 start_codon:yes stop_codon:yes gene_type:complete